LTNPSAKLQPLAVSKVAHSVITLKVNARLEQNTNICTMHGTGKHTV